MAEKIFVILFVAMAVACFLSIGLGMNYNLKYDKAKEELQSTQEDYATLSAQINMLQNNLSSKELEATDLQEQVATAQNKIPSFIPIAEKIGEREWVYPDYICGDFSRDLVSQLRAQGWKANIQFVYWYNKGNGTCSSFNYEKWKCKHYIVKITVPIEATTGKIIFPSDYKKYYQEI